MSGTFWNDRAVMVTGGAGFLGRHVVDQLRERASDVEIFVPRSDDYDLRDQRAVRRAFEDSGADVVVHLAATVGGIGATDDSPGRYFYDNASMGIELIEQARQFGVETCTVVGTALSYPDDAPIPFKETDIFDGYPEPAGAPYGIAKRALLTQLRAYHRQWGFDSAYLVPTNLYGPGDDFDPATANVIPANIRRCIEARERDADAITAWGTGEPTRDFLYVRDAAAAVLDATEQANSPDPINLGSGTETSIRELIETIADLTEFAGRIEWDTSKPDGQARQRVDSTRARDRLGWTASTELREGLRRTIEWYENSERDENSGR